MKKLLLSILITSTLFATAASNGYLGVSVNTYKNGAQVTLVLQHSAAKLAGIQLKDIITSVNGKTIATKEELVSELSKFNIDEKVSIDLIRNDKPLTITTTLGKRPYAKKYIISKQQKAEETWFFANEKIALVFKKDELSTIAQTDDKGNIQSLLGKESIAEIDDMLESVQQLKESQPACNCKCDQYYNFTFYKIIPDAVKPESNNISLIVDKFTIAPNPTDGNFLVDFASKEKGLLQFSILDIAGRTVKADVVQAFDGFYTKQINMENEAKGAYFIQFQIGDKTSTKKIVLQ